MNPDERKTYRAYRCEAGADGEELIASSDEAGEAFNTAEMDARKILAALNDKIAGDGRDDAGKPYYMAADEVYRQVEIRQSSDGLLVYYFDVVEDPPDEGSNG